MASNRRNLFWTLAHIGLGFISTLIPFALIGWFYLILFGNITKSLNGLSRRKLPFFLMLFGYLVSFEVLDRMAHTSPFIPYELGKYFLVLMGVTGIFLSGIRSKNGIFLAVIISLGLLYDFSNQIDKFDIINYWLGPLAVGLGIAFADKAEISKSSLNAVLKFVFWGCLASLAFTYIKTPDFEEIHFGLQANFATTGGHSSNQVSTVLGLGMFLSFYSFYFNLKFTGNRILDGIIFIGFAFQGLLTFSRGGVITGAVGILLLMFLPVIGGENQTSTSSISKGASLRIITIAIASIYFVFEAANDITGGNLLLRYQGQTEGTLRDKSRYTLDKISTGRVGIFEKDFALFIKNPLTGVGLGASKYLRDTEKLPVAAHVELSRLLADHGFLGIIYAFSFFIGIPKNVWVRNKKSSARNILIALLVIAITTTFHAAMRTFVTPLFMILGVLNIKT